jgi:hypothetical protein
LPLISPPSFYFSLLLSILVCKVLHGLVFNCVNFSDLCCSCCCISVC